MIKSEIVNNKTVCDYPFIGESDNNIVLFTGYGEGIVIACKPSSVYKVGHYGKDWTPSSFTPYQGKIVLSNEL